MKRKNISIIMMSFFCCASCKNMGKEIKENGYSIRGDIKITATDTIFEGPIEYYNSANKLVEVSNYHENKRQGKSIIYYANGKIEEESYYIGGYKSGRNVLYDSLGKLIQKANFWNGLAVGSQEFYKSDSLQIYRFVSFEGIPLYRAEYDWHKGLLESGSPLYYVSNYSDDDNLRRILLFIYIMNPPGKKLTYRIFDTDTTRKDTALIKTIKPDSTNEFTTFYLNLPKQNHKYFFEIEAYYSRKGLTVKNILRQSELDLVMPGGSKYE